MSLYAGGNGVWLEQDESGFRSDPNFGAIGCLMQSSTLRPLWIRAEFVPNILIGEDFPLQLSPF